MCTRCHPPRGKLPRALGLARQSRAVQRWPGRVNPPARFPGWCCAGYGHDPSSGQRKVPGAGSWARPSLLRGAAAGPAPVPHGVSPRDFCLPPSRGGKPCSPCLAAAAAIEGLCVSRHKVGIDAVSPPPAVLSRTANGSNKGTLLPPAEAGGLCPAAPQPSCGGAGDPQGPVPACPRPTVLLLLRFLPGPPGLPAAGPRRLGSIWQQVPGLR